MICHEYKSVQYFSSSLTEISIHLCNLLDSADLALTTLQTEERLVFALFPLRPNFGLWTPKERRAPGRMLYIREDKSCSSIT